MAVELPSLDEQVQREHAVYLQVERHILETEIRPRVRPEIIEEHRRRPIGKHSDDLERVLIYVRRNHLEMEGKYILVCTKPHEEYRIAQLTGRPGPPELLPTTYPNRGEAEHALFLKRLSRRRAPARVRGGTMKVIGYSKELSVFPGDEVNFLVSCETDRYHADIVKLIHGDTNPAGPGFKIEPKSTNIDADFQGRVQRVYAGSHVLVDDHPRLHLVDELTLQVLIWPTTPEKGVQGLLTKWDGSREAGYGLFIGENASIEGWLGDGAGNVQRVSSGKPLLAGCWYLAARRSAAAASRLHQEPIVTVANGRFALATVAWSRRPRSLPRIRCRAPAENPACHW